MMNNSGALYVQHADQAQVAAAIERWMIAAGFRRVDLPPGAISGRIMVAEKRRRLFFVAPPAEGWVAIWEDPRYFGDRDLARHLAEALGCRAIWVEVSGNGVGWARGVYDGPTTVEECFDEVETTFYGEYGVVRFTYDIETPPEEFIAHHGLPYADLHYEAVVAGELPAAAGAPAHLAFER